MRRSQVADAATEHRRRVELLFPTAESLQPNDDGFAKVPLHLDLLPAALQYLLSTRTGIEQHVAYQSLERLVMQALGLGRLLPPERFANLREFETVFMALFGERAVHFLHGQGCSGDAQASGTMNAHANAAAVDLCNAVVFLSKHNSGIHSADTIRRGLPAADLVGGAQLHNLLNFYEAAIARGAAVTFRPALGCSTILCDVGMDGLMLGAGTMVDEQALKVVGLRRRVGYKEAQCVLAMDDAQVAAWYAETPALQTAVRATPPYSPRAAPKLRRAAMRPATPRPATLRHVTPRLGAPHSVST
jgi:hypothetical protein